MKKNNFKSLAAVLSLAMAATAVPVNVNAAAAPKITVNKKTVYSGKTASVTVNNLKKGYTVQFSSTEGGVNFKQKKVKATGAKVTAKFTVKAAGKIADNQKTKIKAVVKNASGKKVKTIKTATVTLKQLAKSLTMKDLVETTVQVGAEVNADATLAPKAAKGAYKKTFTASDTSVLQVVNSKNGLFKAVAPGTATISVTAVNDKGKVVEGSKTLTVTVVEAGDNTNQPGDNTNQPTDTNKPDESNTNQPTTGSAITTNYQLTLSAGKTTIEANSKDTTDIAILLTAPTGTVTEEMKKTMAVAVQLTFSTKGVGSLSQDNATILWNEEKQGWYGVVKFTSATLEKDTLSVLTAAVSNEINTPESLIGLVSNSLEFTLSHATPEVEDSVAVQAIDAVVEDLDRITITFNKPVSRDFFLLDNGEVANGLNHQNVENNEYPLKFEMYIKDDVNETTDKAWPRGSVPDINYNREKKVTDNLKTGLEKRYLNENGQYEIDLSQEDVEDILSVEGNDHSLTFVLKNDENSRYFTDNSRFLVTFTDRHVAAAVEGRCDGYITDTKDPSVMDVKAIDMKTLIVTFDQPIYTQKGSGGTIDEKRKLLSALNLANYQIDGMNLADASYYADGSSYFGNNVYRPEIELYADADKPGSRTRNQVKITLGRDGEDRATQRYLKSGLHLVQVANVGDYAALTETKIANRIVTKTFNVNVEEKTALPDFNVVAQSPEQFKVTFTTQIAQLEDFEPGEEIPYDKIPFELQFKDGKPDSGTSPKQTTGMTDYRNVGLDDVKDGTQRKGLEQKIKCTRIEDTADGKPQVKIEVINDWTQLKIYKEYYKNYYNYLLRVYLAPDKLINSENGKKNGECKKPITALEIDTKNPEILELQEVTKGTEYAVTFSEPIQADNEVLKGYGHTFTPKWYGDKDKDKIVEIPTMTVDIVDKESKLTYPAKVTGWASLDNTKVYISTIGYSPLPDGHKFDLIVRAVSDDVGNTSNTLVRPFETKAGVSEETTFKILSILADTNYYGTVSPTSINGGINGLRLEQKYPNNGDNNLDAIYVEFSTMYQSELFGDSVLANQNWTINGGPLPIGTKIIKGIPGYEQESTWEKGHSYITILLEDNTLTDISSTLIKIAPKVKAKDGKTLTGMTTFTAGSVFTDSNFDGKNNLWKGYYDTTIKDWKWTSINEKESEQPNPRP